METLTIQYSCSKLEKTTAISCSTFLFAVSLYLLISEALSNNYKYLFFISIAGAILAIITFFTFSWWQPRPLIAVNNQSINVSLPKIKNQIIKWGSIKDIAIGGGHLKITAEREIFLDFGSLKHSDINRIKSKIVEICETKGITFQND